MVLGALGLGAFFCAGFYDCLLFVDLLEGWGGVVGDFGDHVVGVLAELDAADVADGGVEGAENEFGALEFDGAAQQGVDDFHERGLDGLFVLEEGVVMDAGGGIFDRAEHALVKVAELLSAEGGGAATDAGDFDMSAGFRVRHELGPFGNRQQFFRSSELRSWLQRS